MARQFGKPAVVGAEELEIDLDERELRKGDLVVKEGDWISIDGTRASSSPGKLPTVVPDLKNPPPAASILAGPTSSARLGVRANADYPRDAERAPASTAPRGSGSAAPSTCSSRADRLQIVQR